MDQTRNSLTSGPTYQFSRHVLISIYQFHVTSVSGLTFQTAEQRKNNILEHVDTKQGLHEGNPLKHAP